MFLGDRGQRVLSTQYEEQFVTDDYKKRTMPCITLVAVISRDEVLTQIKRHQRHQRGGDEPQANRHGPLLPSFLPCIICGRLNCGTT